VNGNYNTAGSYGITGYPALTINAQSPNIPSFIKTRSPRSAASSFSSTFRVSPKNDQMLSYFNAAKAK